MNLRIRDGGAGDSVLLLLHGMGATGDVWRSLLDVLDRHWTGRCVVPDLPGHGGSAPLEHYSFDALAAAVAAALPPTSRLRILGHSLGGVVALALGSGRFGVVPELVVGLGIKVHWSDDDLARARALAAKPNPVYATRAEAAERHLKVAGLVGLIEANNVGAEALRQMDSGWTLAFDPAAFSAGAPNMPALLTAAKCPVVLAAGSRDPMCLPDQLRALVPDPVILDGLGHNAHVERSDMVAPLISDRRGGALPLKPVR